MPRKSQDRSPSLFYGYSADLVAQWCGVSRRTASAYKRGKIAPSRAVMRLFVLHRDRRVLPSSWERGWVLTSDAIVDPEGNELSRVSIRGYSMLMQWAAGLARDRGLQDEFYRRLKIIGRA